MQKNIYLKFTMGKQKREKKFEAKFEISSRYVLTQSGVDVSISDAASVIILAIFFHSNRRFFQKMNGQFAQVFIFLLIITVKHNINA